MAKKTFEVKGMDCASCAKMIELDLEDAGVVAKCDFAKEILEVEYDEKIKEEEIKKVVENSGYSLRLLA